MRATTLVQETCTKLAIAVSDSSNPSCICSQNPIKLGHAVRHIMNLCRHTIPDVVQAVVVLSMHVLMMLTVQVGTWTDGTEEEAAGC